jgi:glyoxylase-like metal-dependent hydrolase (beta-lactamase superfamily II)
MKGLAMRVAICLVGFVILTGVANGNYGAAFQTASDNGSRIRMRTLRPGDVIYVLLGAGGNSLALMREDGIVLVDTKLPEGGRQILQTVEAVSDRPVTTIINTNAHIDRTGGNVAFSTVKDIIAHERTKAAMAKMPAFAGANARFLPNKTVTDRMSLFEGPDRMELYYFGAGHTDGDLVVVFPEKRIAYFGDLFPSKSAPVIDTDAGGSGVAFPETLARAVAELKNIMQVITGHEEGLSAERDRRADSVDISTPKTMRWADVQEYADFNRDFLAAVRTAKAAGTKAADAAATLKLPDKYKDYDMRQAAANVEAIYRELDK